MRNKSQSPYESFMREYREFERRIEKAVALKDPRRQRTKKEHVMKTREIHNIVNVVKTDLNISSISSKSGTLGRPPPIFSQILITQI